MNGVILWSTGGQEFLVDKVAPGSDEKCAAVLRRMGVGEDDAIGNYNAYWNELSYRTGPVSKVGDVRASVFAVQGMQDQNVPARNFSEWWAGLRRGVQRKAWVSQYGHMDPFDFRRDVWVDTLHKWFDHELMGVPNDVLRQPRADVQLGPDHWITQADWPAPTRTLTLRPRHDGSLGIAPSTGTGSYLETLQTEATTAGDPGSANPYRLAYLTPRGGQPGLMDAQNRTSLSHSTPLTTGRPYRISWSLSPLDDEVEAGHRLGLVLTGTDADLTRTAEAGTGATVTVDLAGSSVSLPQVTGAVPDRRR